MTPPTPGDGPNRVIPMLFLALFALALAVHFSVPWLTTGAEGAETVYTWAHKYDETTAYPDSMNPTVWSLAAGITGLVLSLAWVVASRVLDRSVLTRGREAAAAALLAVPTFLLVTGGVRGFAQALQVGEGISGTGSPWGFSMAGTILTLLGLGAIVLVAMSLLPRMTARRAPAWLLVGVLASTVLYHGLPWVTENGQMGDPDPDEATNRYRDSYGATAPGTEDALDVLGVGLFVALVLSILWTASVALLPQAPRRDAVIDATFALAFAGPVVLATIGVSRAFGHGLARMFTTTDTWGFSLNGYVFLAIVGLSVALMWTTLRRSYQTLGVDA